MTPMLAAALVLLAAAGTAEVTVSYDQGWTGRKDVPLVFTVGALAAKTLEPGGSAGPLRVPASASGTVVRLTVKLGTDAPATHPLVLQEGARVLIRGNPCARFEVIPQPEADFVAPQVRFDTTRLPKARHPVRVLSSYDRDAPRDDVEEAELAAPGTTEPLRPAFSAMCPRSGIGFTVVDAKRKVLFSERAVLPEGRVTTIHLAPGGAWTATVGERVAAEE